MSRETKRTKKGRAMWGLIYVFAFIIAFFGSAAFKVAYRPFGKEFSVDWNHSVGEAHTDLSYGDGEAKKFDLYVPADNTKDSYGLIVYLHAGGFTGGDKSDDAQILKWLCSKGYVTSGINYTLFSEDKNPDANVYTQSMEMKESMPYVVAEAKKLGYQIDEMAIGGGSAGHALAMLYAYRDADESPVPVKITFGASLKLRQALETNGIDHQFFEMRNSGHGLQNDTKMYADYMRKTLEYLDIYMPVK